MKSLFDRYHSKEGKLITIKEVSHYVVILSQILPVFVIHRDSDDPTEWAGAIEVVRFGGRLKAMRASLEAPLEKLGRLVHGMDFKWRLVPYFNVKRKENPEILITRS